MTLKDKGLEGSKLDSCGSQQRWVVRYCGRSHKLGSIKCE